jgi:hypothetical protein
MRGSCRHSDFASRILSRRRLLGSAAAATGALAAPGLWAPTAHAESKAARSEPRPIPGGVEPGGFGILVHHFPPVPLLGPGPINEPSEITDFSGLVGTSRVVGAGTGKDHATGITSRLTFQVDNGFMSGLYMGQDGRAHHGTFAFV